MAGFKLETPLLQISGIGPRFLSLLAKLELATIGDLLWHFPVRYEDFSHVVPIADLAAGEHVTVSGIIRTIDVRRSFRRRMTIIEATIEDETGSIRAVWFNQPYLKNVLAPGRHANFSGKVAFTDRELYLSHPTHEVISSNNNGETRHTGRLVPVYPETRGLTSKGIRFLIQPILQNLAPVQDYLPENILKENNLPEVSEALRSIHFPATFEEALAAKRRFSFEDVFLLQLFNFQQKLILAKEPAPALETDIEKLKELLTSLPFALTPSQKKSLWEVIKDIAKPHPMNRLLQGDVGSGKTVVAMLAALIACENGYQTAFMAPTEVLAQQHFETIKKLFAHMDTGTPTDSPSRIALCLPIAFTTSHTAKIFYGDGLESSPSKRELETMLARGNAKIIIGTHALIQKSVSFDKLGLVIIDEQHRFGVRQRASLAKGAGAKLMPHFLSMSATPIPRTLMLTVFGDLDISTITELPAGRKEIDTKIIEPDKRDEAYGFIRQQIKEGRQAFVICPRIEPSAAKRSPEGLAYTPSIFNVFDPLLEVKSVKEEYEKLATKVFPDLRVAMLHGQMKAKEKEEIMRGFRNHESDVLVSTSVIEVGVDVPNATIMMIEGSERFGLAQLYQFRGRVGRGEHQSYCLLFTQSDSKTTTTRLKALLEAKNGLELAEWDLKIRGPGEFLGEGQTGVPDLAMRSLQDISLIKAARDAAAAVINQDPRLSKHPLLKAKVAHFQQTLHLE